MADEKCPCLSVEQLQRRVENLESKNDTLINTITTIRTDIAEMKTQLKMFLFVAAAIGTAMCGVIVNSILRG